MTRKIMAMVTLAGTALLLLAGCGTFNASTKLAGGQQAGDVKDDLKNPPCIARQFDADQAKIASAVRDVFTANGYKMMATETAAFLDRRELPKDAVGVRAVPSSVKDTGKVVEAPIVPAGSMSSSVKPSPKASV